MLEYFRAFKYFEVHEVPVVPIHCITKKKIYYNTERTLATATALCHLLFALFLKHHYALSTGHQRIGDEVELIDPVASEDIRLFAGPRGRRTQRDGQSPLTPRRAEKKSFPVFCPRGFLARGGLRNFERNILRKIAQCDVIYMRTYIHCARKNIHNMYPCKIYTRSKFYDAGHE